MVKYIIIGVVIGAGLSLLLILICELVYVSRFTGKVKPEPPKEETNELDKRKGKTAGE